jgi:hypothetical protein
MYVNGESTIFTFYCILIVYAAVGFDVLTTCQPSSVWCSRERLPAAAAQPAKVRQSL